MFNVPKLTLKHVVSLEREDGIIVREGVHYVTVFDKGEEMAG